MTDVLRIDTGDVQTNAGKLDNIAAQIDGLRQGLITEVKGDLAACNSGPIMEAFGEYFDKVDAELKAQIDKEVQVGKTLLQAGEHFEETATDLAGRMMQ